MNHEQPRTSVELFILKAYIVSRFFGRAWAASAGAVGVWLGDSGGFGAEKSGTDSRTCVGLIGNFGRSDGA